MTRAADAAAHAAADAAVAMPVPAPQAVAGTQLPALRLDGPAWAMLLVLSLFWGGSFIFIEILLTALPVLTIVALRALLAAVGLWVIVLATGVVVPRRLEVWLAFAAIGLVNNAIPHSLIAWGQTEITAGLAAILNATTPLFASIIAGLTLADERLSARKVGGVILGLAGVAVMIGPAYLLDLGQHLPYQLAVVGAAFSYGIAAVLGRQFARLKVAPTMAATGQLSATAVMLVPVALLHDGPVVFFVTDPAIWLTVFANAALSTALAYILYFAILSRSGATNVTLVTVLVPVVAILIGVFGLGEHIGAIEFLGMALIFAGLAVIDGRLWHALRRAGKTSTSRP